MMRRRHVLGWVLLAAFGLAAFPCPGPAAEGEQGAPAGQARRIARLGFAAEEAERLVGAMSSAGFSPT